MRKFVGADYNPPVPDKPVIYKGAFDGPLNTYHPKGFVVKGTGNAVWGMQFIWPIKADFRIAYLDDDYREKRKENVK